MLTLRKILLLEVGHQKSEAFDLAKKTIASIGFDLIHTHNFFHIFIQIVKQRPHLVVIKATDQLISKKNIFLSLQIFLILAPMKIFLKSSTVIKIKNQICHTTLTQKIIDQLERLAILDLQPGDKPHDIMESIRTESFQKRENTRTATDFDQLLTTPPA